ncbi:hypothetical protein B0H17DRAFT_1152369 [Mycena rosella]|uniref:Uncharacterized protein n=1 Tax=Mycena rosella TaxID=1033263 RepID=A0AAD7BEB8_MYCRO|nr:hypothetical protein B0H17DRAFT_1152369 [Mycena rosella]
MLSTERHKTPGNRAYIFLRVTSIALHILLILLHLLLLGLWAAPHLEHKVVFPVDHQGFVALWITVVATSFGTIYLSITLYVIQKLAIHSDLCKEQTLTSTHDHLLSWTGTGSAFLNLWKQFQLPASVLGTPCFLLNHSTSQFSPLHRLKDFQSGQAQIMRNLDESKTLGLFNGSLYDVLSTTNPGDGEAMVSAVGFNITCGYLRGVNPLDVQMQRPVDRKTSSQWPGYDYIDFSFKSLGSYFIDPIAPNIIATSGVAYDADPQNITLWNSLIVYTANTVIDSDGNTGFPVHLINATGPNSSVTDIQFLQCSKHSVPQYGQVDSKTGNIISSSLQPTIFKNHSKWSEYVEPSRNNSNQSMLDSGLWAAMTAACSSNVPTIYDWPLPLPCSALYLTEHLGLDPTSLLTNISLTPGPVLYLHDIENALSSLVASLFWIAGHIHPAPLRLKYQSDSGNVTQPVLSTSSAPLVQVVSAARLNISLGLGSSIILFGLAIRFWHIHTHSGPKPDGTGLLHIMWLSQRHSEVTTQLKQVQEPTDNNLRTVGMIKASSHEARSSSDILSGSPSTFFLAFLAFFHPHGHRYSSRAISASPQGSSAHVLGAKFPAATLVDQYCYFQPTPRASEGVFECVLRRTPRLTRMSRAAAVTVLIGAAMRGPRSSARHPHITVLGCISWRPTSTGRWQNWPDNGTPHLVSILPRSFVCGEQDTFARAVLDPGILLSAFERRKLVHMYHREHGVARARDFGLNFRQTM